jgi:hypothetical protein
VLHLLWRYTGYRRTHFSALVAQAFATAIYAKVSSSKDRCQNYQIGSLLDKARRRHPRLEGLLCLRSKLQQWMDESTRREFRETDIDAFNRKRSPSARRANAHYASPTEDHSNLGGTKGNGCRI